MREVDQSVRSGLPKRGVIIALTAAGVVGLLVVAVVMIAPATRGGETRAAPRWTTTATVSTSPSPRPPLGVNTAIPRRVQPLKARLLFGAQSLAADIVKGIPLAFSSAHIAKPKITSWNRAMNTRGPLVATAKIGNNGNPRSKLRAFAELVNDAPRGSVDVALMAFSYQDITAETDVERLFDDYAETMESIQSANPDILFLYATTPVSTANSWRAVDQATVMGLRDVDQPVWQDNIARERLNSFIRDQYGPTGRLFDIAALQARIGGGKVAAKIHETQYYYVMNPELSSDGKQLNKRGSTQLADALMRLVATARKT